MIPGRFEIVLLDYALFASEEDAVVVEFFVRRTAGTVFKTVEEGPLGTGSTAACVAGDCNAHG